MTKISKKFSMIKSLSVISIITLPPIISTSCTMHIIIHKDTIIKLFQTSDIHGYLIDTTSNDEAIFQYRLAYIANQIQKARENIFIDDVLLLDGGDIYQGQVVSNFTEGAALRAALDLMKYDAVTLGNHEFDWTLGVSCSENGTIKKYDVANKGKYKNDNPNIPVLAANLYYDNEEKPNKKRVEYTKDYVIINKANKKIALIGYIPDYSNDIAPDKIAPYYIDDDLEAFNKKIIEIDNLEKPDMTIVMAHANPVPIANNLNHDYVQLVTGGHEHDFKSGIAERTGIPYIQGGWFGQGYASTTIKFKYDNTLTIENSECINIISNDIQSRLYDNDENKQYLDKNILELSHFAWDYIADKMLERLGYIKTSIIRNRKINGNGTATSAGNWVTSLFKEGTNVDVAFYNTDGIRASFEVPDGGKKVITLGNIYSILPFNNLLYIYEVNGKQLKQHLLNGIKYSNYGDQLTGLKFKYTIDSNGNIEITEIILDNGTVVNMDDENTLYRICLSSYSSNLEGSIVNEFGLEPINKQTAKTDAEVVIDMIKKHCGSTDPNEFLIEVDLSERGVRV